MDQSVFIQVYIGTYTYGVDIPYVQCSNIFGRIEYYVTNYILFISSSLDSRHYIY
jgi:hypothetical protein